jgi:hypothetical protein
MLLSQQRRKNNMTKITHDNAVKELLDRIPELKSYHQFDDFELGQPTIVFDHFGDFLLDRIIKSQPADEAIIKISFDFINETQESEDPDVQNLPQIGVFEVLAGSKKAIKIADTMLNENGREWFNKVKQRFNPQ